MKSEPPRPDSAALIDAAAARGHEVTARSLELWRYKGLLPRPRRQPSGRAVWLYPAGTDDRLFRLLHWRERTRNLDEVLLALWVEGFEIELDRVRAALARFVDRWSEMIEVEIGGASEEDGAAVVDALARRVARMRGERSLPRVSRMRLSERERACGYLVAAMLGMEDELAKREADLPHLERLVGLRRGHDGGLAAVLGSDVRSQAASLPTPARATEAVRGASPHELEYVRRILRLLLVVLPVAVPTLFADHAAKAIGAVEFARRFLADPPPGLFPFMLTALLVPLRENGPGEEELSTHLDTLGSTSLSASQSAGR